jgi:hypothetical protein
VNCCQQTKIILKSSVTWQPERLNNEARRNCLLLGNGSVNTYRGNGNSRDNIGTVENGVFYAVRTEAI